MPRICASNNIPYDFCVDCFPSEEDAEKRYYFVGDGSDDRGNCFAYEVEHPDYGMDEYFCEDCGSRLDNFDN